MCQLNLGQPAEAFEDEGLRRDGTYVPGLAIAYAQAALGTENANALAAIVDDLLEEPAAEAVDTLRATSRFA